MFLQQCGSLFPRSVRPLLAFLVTAYLAALAGRFFGIIDLHAWLALSSPAFWNGHVWQVITYPVLPAGFQDLITNVIILNLLAAGLETVWTARQLWTFSLIAALSAGLGKALLLPYSLTSLMGLSGVIFGLLVACGRQRASVATLLTGLRAMSVGQMLLIISVLGFLLNILRRPGEQLDYLPLLCGGITGWLYPLRQWKSKGIEPELPVTSARIGKLEL